MRRESIRHRRWAWMAVFAIWLTVLAPTVSRVSAFAFPDLGAWCEPATAHHHAEGGATHDEADGACGYCTLFAQSPGMSGGVQAVHVAWLSVTTDTPSHVGTGIIPATTLPFNSRGPPVAAHA